MTWTILKYKISNLWYWIRTHTIHRYHMLDMRSPQNGYKWGWQDRSDQILYANFAILKKFVEEECPTVVNYTDSYIKDVPKDDISWDILYGWHKAILEIKELYLWWTKGRAEHQNKVTELYRSLKLELPDCGIFQNIDPEPTKKFKKWIEEDNSFSKNDDVMLERLIKIRNYLWT